jgi:hypothetical protein
MIDNIVKMKLIVATCFIISLVAESSLQEFDFLDGKSETNKLPFILSNEQFQEETLLALLEIPRPENGVHIGWSVEMNYKILVTRRPKIAFLCDISFKVIEFYELFKKLVLSAKSGAEVLENLPKALSENRQLLRFGFYKDHQMKELIRRYAIFLLPSDNFAYLQRMYNEKRIKHLFLNVADQEERFFLLANALKKEAYVVDTIYTSNIIDVIRNKKAAEENLKQLFDLHTLHIYADDQVKLKIKSCFDN